MIGGFQIFFLGVIGEYVGRVYTEAKGRPRYLISDVVNPVDLPQIHVVNKAKDGK